MNKRYDLHAVAAQVEQIQTFKEETRKIVGDLRDTPKGSIAKALASKKRIFTIS